MIIQRIVVFLDIVKQYKKIKICNSPKYGLGPSRNCGIQNANAKYIWFIDADDELCDESIDNKFLTLLEKSDSDLFLLGVEKISQNKDVYLLNKNAGSYKFNENSEEIQNLFLDNIFNNSWNKLYRKKVIDQDKKCCFDEVSSVEDILFNCKFLTIANEVTVINKVFYKYYIYSKTSTKWRWQEDS
ncbi:glycosyltransferase [Limosilactobacillus vaginalis]